MDALIRSISRLMERGNSLQLCEACNKRATWFSVLTKASKSGLEVLNLGSSGGRVGAGARPNSPGCGLSTRGVIVEWVGCGARPELDLDISRTVRRDEDRIYDNCGA